MRFAMNHIAAPKLSLEDFFAMARALGATEAEIRNDLPDVLGSRSPAEVKAAAERAGAARTDRAGRVAGLSGLVPAQQGRGDPRHPGGGGRRDLQAGP